MKLQFVNNKKLKFDFDGGEQENRIKGSFTV